MNSSDVKTIQDRIGYVFKDVSILDAAFTHSSYVNEHRAEGNERIEFLGDCALNFCVGEKLFHNDTSACEGELSAHRSALVQRAPLSRIVDKLGIMEFLRVGAGVNKKDFSEKARSDLFEAVVGGVYLDGGLDAVRGLLDGVFYPNAVPERDYKSCLQNYAVKHGLKVDYKRAVPSQDGFSAVVGFGEREFSGSGKSVREAQIAAAKAACEALGIV